MRRIISLILLLIMMFSLIACQKTINPTPSPSDTDIQPQETQNPSDTDEEPQPSDVLGEIPGSDVGTKLDNFKTIATITDKLYNGENTLYSPFSFNCAIAMASLGANEEIKKDFEAYFGVSFDEYLNFYRQYIESLDSTVEIANSVWLRNDFTYNPTFEQKTKDYFKAEVGSDYFNNELVQKINQWCAEKTHNMIPSIIDEFTEEQVSVILNALYFKGDWKEEYENSVPTTFHGINGDIQVDGLYSKENIYLKNDNAEGFIKYYKGDRYAFIGILPNKTDWTFKSLDLSSLLNSQQVKSVNVMIPKFEFDGLNTLSPLLPDIGLGGLLNDGSLTELANDSLHVGTIVQKTKIKLDEKGTEASAVTAITIVTNSAMEESTKIYLNRPFAFMIYDTQTNTILFIGKVVNPLGA